MTPKFLSDTRVDGKRFLMMGQGFETPRLISAVVTVERLITSRLGFDAD